MVFRHIFFLTGLLFFGPLAGQEKGTGPREKSFKQELKTNKQIRHEAREKRRMEKAERKAIKKHHKRLQTKEVRKRMKSNRKRATRYNTNKREFFLTRWFKKSKLGGRKR